MSKTEPFDELGRPMFSVGGPKSTKMVEGNRIKLHATCKCGATFFIDDEKGTLAVQGGGFDQNGHYYRFENLYRKWWDLHEACYKRED